MRFGFLFLSLLILLCILACNNNSIDSPVSEEDSSVINGELRSIDNSTYIEDNGFNCINSSSDGNMILAASAHSHIYLSANSGEQWYIVNGLGKEYWTGVSVSNDGELMAVAGKNLYITENSGQSWTAYSFGDLYDGEALVSMSDDGSLIVIAKVHRTNDLYISEDYGQTWVSDTIESDISSIYVSRYGGLIAALARDNDLMLSNDKGESWEECGFEQEQWLDLAGSSDGKHLMVTNFSAIKFEGEEKSEIIISNDYGASWNTFEIDGIKPLSCQPAVSDDGNSIIVSSNTVGTPFKLSRDGGVSWTTLNQPPDVEDPYWPTFQFSFGSGAERLIAMEEEGSVWTYSDDDGWIRQLNGYNSD